ncbi:hypothetical protein [Micromonospora chersina]|uniref:hypothetical protein n=1 Tax=Micromonospora chersina TaxID=47854 RepID=UPI0033A296F9
MEPLARLWASVRGWWLWDTLHDWNSGNWSAAATVAGLLVALTAAFIALGQAREARRLRKEQAQPYVVAFMEPAAASPLIIDLVVRNFGTTAAFHVTLEASPPLQRSRGDAGGKQDVWIFDELPILAPGQEWRTFWDFSRSRGETDLPDRHEVTVKYEDSQGKKLPESRSTLDWSMVKGRVWTVTYGLHDAAKALREIQAVLKKWQEDIHGGLRVYVRDGAEKDERRRRDFEAWKSQHEEVAERLGLRDSTEPEPAMTEEGGAATSDSRDDTSQPASDADPSTNPDPQGPASKTMEVSSAEVRLKQRIGDGS